jgi:hypothetical protein
VIIYCVTITLDPAIEAEWREWMQRVHIPDVVNTGCFNECRMYKVHGADSAEPAYVMQYHCRSIGEYERYRDNFAPVLQKEHTDKFSGRFRGARQVLEEIGSPFGARHEACGSG